MACLEENVPAGADEALRGYVHSYETGATVDGPGLRVVVFFSGCPLRCLYCHNPDTQHLKEGTLTSIDEVMAEIEPYQMFLQSNGGGVTISGGEPLVQPAFCKEILKRCKALGLHTAIDTSGYLGRAADDDLLKYVDLVLLDIKSGVSETYKQVTNVTLQPTLDFAKRLSDMGKAMWVRFVLVPNLTDGEENVRAVAQHIASLKTVQRVEILPFHKMGEHKWRERGMDYKLSDTPAASNELVAWTAGIFAEYGVRAG